MNELFALDLGNKQVKMKTRMGTKVFPSYFVDAAEYGNRDLLNLKKGEGKTSDYKSVRDDAFTYVWGSELKLRNKFVNDSIRFGNRYGSVDFKLLADFALAEMARDFDDAAGKTLNVTVVTGIPTDDFNQQDVAAELGAALKGSHTVTIDDVTYTVNVVDVHALPQPVGTYIDAVVDAEGYVMEETPLTDNLVGVVDVGGGTVIVDALDGMDLQRDYHAQIFEGAYSMYERIRDHIVAKGHKISIYEVERFVRTGNELGLYLWSPNGIETIDFTETVMTERRRYTRKVIGLAETTFKDFSSFYTILFTGGTSNLLIKDDVIKAISIAKFVEGSETANVLGFYKYGLNSIGAVQS